METKGYIIYYPHLYTLFFNNNKLNRIIYYVQKQRFACLKTTEQRSIGTKIKFLRYLNNTSIICVIVIFYML